MVAGWMTTSLFSPLSRLRSSPRKSMMAAPGSSHGGITSRSSGSR